jgi:hypothetical protein
MHRFDVLAVVGGGKVAYLPALDGESFLHDVSESIAALFTDTWA